MPATMNRISTIPLNDPGVNPRNVPGYVSARALAANTAESITIPTGAAQVRIAGTADFYYSFSTIATVPPDTDDGTACELIKSQSDPEWLIVPAGATALSVISASIAIVTASFFNT